MSLTTTTQDSVQAPADYDAFFRQYWPYIVGFVRKAGGIRPENVEDVAMAICLRFYERDFLKEFNPDFHIEHRGVVYKARFQSLLNKFVIQYLKGHRDRENTQRRREPIICDSPVGDGTSTWIEVYGDEHHDSHEDIESLQTVEYLRSYLAEVPPRSSKDICNLLNLFDVECAMIAHDGLDFKVLAAHFGVSSTAIHSWHGLLRQHIAVALEVRC